MCRPLVARKDLFMKFGFRKPSIKKRISARTSIKRRVTHRAGLKMYGFVVVGSMDTIK